MKTLKLLPIAMCALFLSGGGRLLAHEDATSLSPLLSLVGDWDCTGQYLDLPPVSQSHPVSALFKVRVGLGGTWVTGDYRERRKAQNPAPTFVSDNISVDPILNVGIRAAVDSHLGRIVATFTGYEGATTTYSGSYLITGLALPFSETLVRVGDDTFTTDSRLDLGAGPQTFQTLTCERM